MLLGIPGDATYANYAEAHRAFYRLTVLPLATRVHSRADVAVTAPNLAFGRSPERGFEIRVADESGEAVGAVLSHPDTPIDEIMGRVDALKLRSSATLFEAASPDAETRAPFTRLLDTFYGTRCPLTLAEIGPRD